jgi:SAM-dependent methyltransferase
MMRYVSWLLERSIAAAPKLLSRAEWEAEHQHLRPRDDEDLDFLAALEGHTTPDGRVLDIGTGLGELARAAAKRGLVVVATDFSRRAIERAREVNPSARVTWVVDDATQSSLVGSFDLVLDRGCLGCIPMSARERYVASVASLLSASGIFALKVHAASAKRIRAHGFERDEVYKLTEDGFEPVLVRETTMAFGQMQASPALFFLLRRRKASAST